jgi:hypothetical protein
MNNLTEESEPVAIAVSAFDKDWWGESSIIAGGGGEGDWTRNGPTSYVQGGQGSFKAPSDNHGDADGTTAATIATSWANKNNPYAEGYNKYLIVPRQTEAGYIAPAFKEMIQRLTDPGIWEGFRNLMYTPINAIITCSMIPRKLAPSITGVDYVHAAGVDLTKDNAASTYADSCKAIHIGSVDINTYTDSFADFDNTSVYIHLPYIGNFQLDTAAVMDGTVAVDYLVDYFTCDITALVWVNDRFGNYNYRYEFKGNCGKPMPLTQINPMSSKIATAMLPAVTGLGIGAVAGTVAGVATGVRAAAITTKAARTLKSYGMSTSGIIKNVGGAMAHNFGAGLKEGFGSTMNGLVG